MLWKSKKISENWANSEGEKVYYPKCRGNQEKLGNQWKKHSLLPKKPQKTRKIRENWVNGEENKVYCPKSCGD